MTVQAMRQLELMPLACQLDVVYGHECHPADLSNVVKQRRQGRVQHWNSSRLHFRQRSDCTPTS